MATFYVDLTAGSDSGSGTEGSPYKTFAPINNAAAWSGNAVYVKRGTSGVVNSGTRANIVAAGGALLSVYGDAAAALPMIDGNATNFNPVWVQSGSGIIVEQLHVTNAPGSTIVVGPTAGNNISDVEIRDCLVTRATQDTSLWGTDGLTFGPAAVDGGTITNARALRIVARDCGGHGVKFRGYVNGGYAKDCVAIRCGLTTPAHGLGTAGNMLVISSPGTGWTDTGLTVGGGKVWERAALNPYRTNNDLWYGVWVLGLGPTYYKLPYNEADPANPPPGYCGIGADNTLRINIGALSVASITGAQAVYARPENIHFASCLAAYTTDANGAEGDGIYFDNGSYACASHSCIGMFNDGHTIFMNDCTESGHYAAFGYGNLKGGAGVARGDGTQVHGGVFVCVSGTNGINYNTGNQRAGARMNKIIGAAVGIYANDEATNDVDENENGFIGCATRLQNISGAGARSFDAAFGLSPADGSFLAKARDMLAEAEAVT